jgi:hypothetical protein
MCFGHPTYFASTLVRDKPTGVLFNSPVSASTAKRAGAG